MPNLLDLLQGAFGQKKAMTQQSNADIDAAIMQQIGSADTHAGGMAGWMRDRNLLRKSMGYGATEQPGSKEVFQSVGDKSGSGFMNAITNMLMGGKSASDMQGGMQQRLSDRGKIRSGLQQNLGGSGASSDSASRNDPGSAGANGSGWFGQWANQPGSGVPDVWQNFFNRVNGMNNTMPNFMETINNFGNPYQQQNSQTGSYYNMMQQLLPGLQYQGGNTSAQNSLESMIASLTGRGGPNMPNAPGGQQYQNAPGMQGYGNMSVPWMSGPTIKGLDMNALFGDSFRSPGFNSPTSGMQWQNQGGTERVGGAFSGGQMPSYQDMLRDANSNSGRFSQGRENLPLSNFQQNQLYGQRQGGASGAFNAAQAGAQGLINSQNTDVSGMLEQARKASFAEAARVGKGQAASHGSLGGTLSDRMVSERLGEAANKAYETQANAILQAQGLTNQNRQAGVSAMSGLGSAQAGTGMDIASLLSGENSNLMNALVQQRGQDTQVGLGQFTSPAQMLQALSGAAVGGQGVAQGWQELINSAYGRETDRFSANATANKDRNQFGLDALLGGFRAANERYGAETGAQNDFYNAVTGRGQAQGQLQNSLQELMANTETGTNQMNISALLDSLGLQSQNTTAANQAANEQYNIGSQNTTAMNSFLSNLFNTQTSGAVDSYNAQTNQQNSLMDMLMNLGNQQQQNNQYGNQANSSLWNMLSDAGNQAAGNQHSFLDTVLGAQGTQSDQFFTMMQFLQWMSEFDPKANPKGGTQAQQGWPEPGDG